MDQEPAPRPQAALAETPAALSPAVPDGAGGSEQPPARRPVSGAALTAAMAAVLADMPPTRSTPDEIATRRKDRLKRLRSRPAPVAAGPEPSEPPAAGETRPAFHDWETDPRPFAHCLREWGRRRHGTACAHALGAADLRLPAATYTGYCHGLRPACEAALRRLMTLLDRFVPPA